MPQEIRLWRINNDDSLAEMAQTALNLEDRLEDWLEQDISILRDDLLIIARQEPTDFGGVLDLLCLDRVGDLVVVELKRDKTPRDITAQALDYGSWVRDLSHDDVVRIGDRYLKGRGQGDLEEAFNARFGEPLPEILNESHALFVVGSVIDGSTERIIRYLSDEHGVRINAVTFGYFRTPTGEQTLARVFLLEPDRVEQSSARKGGTKRRAAPSLEEFHEDAAAHGVGDLFGHALESMPSRVKPYSMSTMVSCYVNTEDGSKPMFGIYPRASSSEKGLHFTVYLWRISEHLGTSPDDVEASLPEDRKPWSYASTSDHDGSGFSGYFTRKDQIDRFFALFER